MPLDATRFYVKGPVNSADMRQFYDLFTGAMNDQPVTFVNTLSVGGNQGVTTVPLRIFGAPGQNTNLIDLYPDRTSAQPSFGFSAVGQFAWGPGGSAPQDTFLNRIATQHGHAGADSAGLLITPQLEVAGYISADTDVVVDRNAANAGTALGPGIHFGGLTMGEGIGSQRTAAGGSNQYGVDIWAGGVKRLQVFQNGIVTVNSYLNVGANLTVTGDIVGHYLHTSDGANGIVMADAGALYLRCVSSSVVVIDGANGLYMAGRILWTINGYYWEGIKDLALLHTNGSLLITGGTIYFEDSRQVYITWRPDLQALYIPYGNGIYVGGPGTSIFTSDLRVNTHINFNGAPNSPNARLIFPQEAAPKICFYDNGGNDYWGMGINSGEMYVCAHGVFTVRATNGGGAVVASFNTSNGQVVIGQPSGTAQIVMDPSGTQPQITFVTPNDPQAGGQMYRNIKPSNRAASVVGGGEVEIDLRIYAPGDITAGTYVHGISFVSTSDPALKSNQVLITDDQCMTRVRGNMPVYSYTIEPPVAGGVAPTPTDVGFMAPDVYATAPEFAALAPDGTPVGVTYSNMSAMLWGALRQLDARCTAKGI